MSRFKWKADAAAGKCWVVYERVSYKTADDIDVYAAVLTVWDTTPVQLTGRHKYTSMDALHTLLNVTKDINGGVLPDDVIEAVVVTMEILE